MYLSHYNLSKIPFSISPDPNFLWLSEKHSEALATLKYGIFENKGFLVLTGNVGTGKTALINRLIKEISLPVLIATIPDPGLNITDFFKFLANDLGLNEKFDTKGDFLILFKNFLLQAYSSDKKVLLIIDEAQRLSHDLLEQIRLLSNIELENRKLINIFYVGQSEFNKMLMVDKNKATRQRIAVRYHLKPLTEKETAQYIQYRLKIAHGTREIFQPKAIRQIFYLSGGNPRLINILCDRCLLTGYSKGLQSISDSIVKECGQELQITVDKKGQRIDKPVFSQKEKNQDPKKAFKYRFGKIKAAAISLIVLAWCIAGYSYYNSKNGNFILFKNLLSPAEQKESTMNKGEEFFVRSSFANEIANIYQNNYAGNAKKKPIEHPKQLIYFDHNSNELNSRSLRVLDKLSKFILQHPNARVTIEGYTDSKGKFWYNKRLSETRAEIVKSYLVEKGIPSQKIKAVGKGSENPIATNETLADRGNNRRVEIKISLN